MSIKTGEFIQSIERVAPKAQAESWDNIGWQIDLGKSEISKVYIALEITNKVIEDAKKRGADVILTHHPMLFNPVRTIDSRSVIGKYIFSLISAGISVYSAHTNYDSAFGGMNDVLADMLGLNKIRKIEIDPSKKIEHGENPVGRMGEFETPITLEDACTLVKTALGIDAVKIVGEKNAMVRKVALCAGSGSDSIPAAILRKCSLFITGDVKHHQAQAAKESGLNIIDAGHYATENHFVTQLSEKLKDAHGDSLTVIQSTVNADPFDAIV
ncbi:MAG: Nif3-like dinuclear metal center hexameric protein [Clostridiales Family XIII bacterium]|jgi:dinuclear metal center YbgI/SA1388 family protein|nr:Nif3-like dinuclear metal center hexameric protein [Clostridiales Family XIII bacterium]